MITIAYGPIRVAQENLMHLGIEFAKFAEPSAGSLGFGVAAGVLVLGRPTFNPFEDCISTGAIDR
jgi:hypothetical protein